VFLCFLFPFLLLLLLLIYVLCILLLLTISVEVNSSEIEVKYSFSQLINVFNMDAYIFRLLPPYIRVDVISKEIKKKNKMNLLPLAIFHNNDNFIRIIIIRFFFFMWSLVVFSSLFLSLPLGLFYVTIILIRITKRKRCIVFFFYNIFTCVFRLVSLSLSIFFFVSNAIFPTVFSSFRSHIYVYIGVKKKY